MQGAQTAIKAVVYDFDGVIVDSREANETYYNRLLTHFGLPAVQAKHRELIYTRTSKEVIEILFQDPEQARVARVLEKTMDNTDITPMIKIEPYIKETLNILKKRYRTAIATNRGKSLPQVLQFHSLTEYFDLTISSSQLTHPKPHPECLEIILQKFSLAPAQIVYVGDAEIDARLADTAGVRFIAYKNPRLNAWGHIADHREILVLITF